MEMEKVDLSPPSLDTATTSSSNIASSSSTALDNLQGIFVYHLPFPGVLNEKTQREQLSQMVKKFTKQFEIRIGAIPNNNSEQPPTAGNRRFQAAPLIRRALITFHKLNSVECLLSELNRQMMVGCQLKASLASTEDIKEVLTKEKAADRAARVAIVLSGQQKLLVTTKVPIQKQTSSPTSLQSTLGGIESSTEGRVEVLNEGNASRQGTIISTIKRPMNLLRIPIPPSVPSISTVKAILDAQHTHHQNIVLPDPLHKNASRTLYLKHLETNITDEELKARYGKFGHILDIEVKNRNTLSPYAFIQFTDIESVTNAIKSSNQLDEMGRQKKSSTHHWWGNPFPTPRLWIGLLPPHCGHEYLASKVRVVLTSPDQDVTQVEYDQIYNEAILVFSGLEAAQIVFNKIKLGQIKFQPTTASESAHKQVHVDFCSEKLHSFFIDRLFHKNVETDVENEILAPPPDPPKCMPKPKKSSPSPPPDPSIETSNERTTCTILIQDQDFGIHPSRPPSSSDPEVDMMNKSRGRAHTMGTGGEHSRHGHSRHRFKEASVERQNDKKHQHLIANERGAVLVGGNKQEKATGIGGWQQPHIRSRNNSSSSSSAGSGDIHSLSTNKKVSNQQHLHTTSTSQHHHTHKESSSKHAETVEISGALTRSMDQRGRQKQWQKQPRTAKHSWEGKHQSHQRRSSEKRPIKHVEDKPLMNSRGDRDSKRSKKQHDTEGGAKSSKRASATIEQTDDKGPQTFLRESGKIIAARSSSKKHRNDELKREQHYSIDRTRDRKSIVNRSSSSRSPAILPPPPQPPSRMNSDNKLSMKQQLQQEHHSNKAAASNKKKHRHRSCSSSCSSISSCSYSTSGSCSSCVYSSSSSDVGKCRTQEIQKIIKKKKQRNRDTNSLMEKGMITTSLEISRKKSEEKFIGLITDTKIDNLNSFGIDKHNEGTIVKSLFTIGKPEASHQSLEIVETKSLPPQSFCKNIIKEKSQFIMPAIQFDGEFNKVQQQTSMPKKEDELEQKLAKFVQQQQKNPLQDSASMTKILNEEAFIRQRTHSSQEILDRPTLINKRPLVKSAVEIPIEITEISGGSIFIDPRKQQQITTIKLPFSLELPNFALRLKIKKMNLENDVVDSTQQSVVAVKEVSEDLAPTPNLGTRLNAFSTDHYVLKQEQKLSISQAAMDEMIEENETEKQEKTLEEQRQQEKKHPFSSVFMTVINARLKQFNEDIEHRKKILKISPSHYTNIKQMEEEMSVIKFELFSGNDCLIEHQLHHHLPSQMASSSKSYNQQTLPIAIDLQKSRNSSFSCYFDNDHQTGHHLLQKSSESIASLSEESQQQNVIPIQTKCSQIITEQAISKEFLQERRNTMPADSKCNSNTSTAAMVPSKALKNIPIPLKDIHFDETSLNIFGRSKPLELGLDQNQQQSTKADCTSTLNKSISSSKFSHLPMSAVDEKVIVGQHNNLQQKDNSMTKKVSISLAETKPKLLLDDRKHEQHQNRTAISSIITSASKYSSHYQQQKDATSKSEHNMFSPLRTAAIRALSSTYTTKTSPIESRKPSISTTTTVGREEKSSSMTQEKQKEQKSLIVFDHDEHKGIEDVNKVKYKIPIQSNKLLNNKYETGGESSGREPADFTTSDKQHRKKKHRRKHEERTDSTEEEEDEDINIEEQRRALAQIKEGQAMTAGLTLYDRIKRRSSHMYDEELKKSAALEQIREKKAKKNNELSRIRMLSSSSTASDSETSRRIEKRIDYCENRKEKLHQMPIYIPSITKESIDEDFEVDVGDCFSYCTTTDKIIAEQQFDVLTPVKPQQIMEKSEKILKKSIVMDEKEQPQKQLEDEREEGELHLYYCAEDGKIGSVTGRNENSENEEPSECETSTTATSTITATSKAAIEDMVIKKLKMKLECRKCSLNSSEEDYENKEEFELKLADVVQNAMSGNDSAHLTKNHRGIELGTNPLSFSSTSSSDISSSDEDVPSVQKGIAMLKENAPKKVEHLSMEDVFGADSDESSYGEEQQQQQLLVAPPRSKPRAISFTLHKSQDSIDDPHSKKQLSEKKFDINKKRSRLDNSSNNITPLAETIQKPNFTSILNIGLQQEKPIVGEIVGLSEPGSYSPITSLQVINQQYQRSEKGWQPDSKKAVSVAFSTITEQPQSTNIVVIDEEKCCVKRGGEEGEEEKGSKWQGPTEAKKSKLADSKISPNIALKRQQDHSKEKLLEFQKPKKARLENEDAKSNKKEQTVTNNAELDNIDILSTKKPIELLTVQESITSSTIPPSLLPLSEMAIIQNIPSSSSTNMKGMNHIGGLVELLASADGDFEVIDSGKIEHHKIEKPCGKLEEKDDEVIKEVVAEEQLKREDAGERNDHKATADILRQMEQNEEEEAVAALKHSKVTRRSSSEVEDQQRTTISHFFKPTIHNKEQNWASSIIEEKELKASDDFAESIKDYNIEKELKAPDPDHSAEKIKENIVEKELKAPDDFAGRIKEYIVEEELKAPDDSTEKISTVNDDANVVLMETTALVGLKETTTKQDVERRSSNESMDSSNQIPLGGVGTGFVEVDAELLKQQEEKERLEEEEKRRIEESKRMEETVELVAKNAAATLSNFSNDADTVISLKSTTQIPHSIASIQQQVTDNRLQHKQHSFPQSTSMQHQIGAIINDNGEHFQHQQKVQTTNATTPVTQTIQSDTQAKVPTLVVTTQHYVCQQQQQLPIISGKSSASGVPYVAPTPGKTFTVETTTTTCTTSGNSNMFQPQYYQQQMHQPKTFQPQQQPHGLFQQQKQHTATDTLPEQIILQSSTNAKVVVPSAIQTPQQKQKKNASSAAPLHQQQIKIIQQQQNFQTSIHEQQQQKWTQFTQQMNVHQQISQQRHHLAQPQQQEFQHQHHLYQQHQIQTHQQQSSTPTTSASDQQSMVIAAAAATSNAAVGLMDHTSLLSLYQRLLSGGTTVPSIGADIRNQQQQNALLQQQHNISAAMMAAAASSPLTKWHQLGHQTGAAVAQSSLTPVALEGLFRQGLLNNHHSTLLTSPNTLSSSNTFEELFRQQLMSSASPSVQQQQLQRIPAAQIQQQQQTHHQLNPQQNTSLVSSQQEQQKAALLLQQNQQKKQIVIDQQQQKRQNNQRYPVIWQGQLAMKNADTLVQMHKVRGNEMLMEKMKNELVSINNHGIPLIRINQRMRLEQGHIDGLVRKIEREENHIALICLPCGINREDVDIQKEKMQTSFIDYFSSKSAAGIVSSQPESCVAHIFPPSEFSRNLLSKNAPDLLGKVDLLAAGYLLVILTNNLI